MFLSTKKIRLIQCISISVFLFFSICIQAQHEETNMIRQLNPKTAEFLNSYPDSLLYYRDSLFRMAQQLNDNVGISDGYIDFGVYYWITGDNDDAIQVYNQEKGKSILFNEQNKLASVYVNLAMAYTRMEHYPKAINYLLQAIQISESGNRIDFKAGVYNSLGVAQKNSKNYGEAQAAFNRALKLYHQLARPINEAVCYVNLGSTFEITKDYDRAIFYQKRALHKFDSIKNPYGIAIAYNNISGITLRRGEISTALEYALKAKEISESQKFFPGQITALQNIASINLAQTKVTDAIQVLMVASNLAKAGNYQTELVKIYKLLADCYRRVGQSPEALSYFEKYSVLNDSIFNSQRAIAISNLMLAIEIEKKGASIELLTLNNEVFIAQRNFAIFGGVLILLVAGLIVGRQRLKIKLTKQILKKQEELFLTQKAVAFLELRNHKMKEAELQHELDFKNQSLATYALNLVQKNELLEEVRQSVEQIIKAPGDQRQFKQLSKLVDYSLSLDKDWEDFKHYFSDVHQGFFNSLMARFPGLSGAEIKLCALLRLNMNMKQVATILRISPESVKMARHRLRKKFNLQTEDNLVSFIMTV